LDLREDRLRLEIGKLPRIRIIEMDSLLLHEDPDPRRSAALARRLAAEGRLRSPVIAARDHGTVSHILLDGANRVEALRRLGARHVLIQEVDLADKALVLSTWHHVLEGLDARRLVARLGDAAKVRSGRARFTRDGDFIPAYTDDVACLLVLPTKRVFAVLDGASPASRLEVSQRVVAETASASNIDRVSYTNIDDLAANYPDFSALICYRGFSKPDVLRLALRGKRFPSGVTRFGVPKRALAVSVPLGLLTRRSSAAAKQAKLDAMIRKAIETKRIRFYEEPTFYFDD
jgi:hypothetical protein